ncbi:MAG: ABC transporter substrate-binding protein [Alphaproteobacteria bacterium]
MKRFNVRHINLIAFSIAALTGVSAMQHALAMDLREMPRSTLAVTVAADTEAAKKFIDKMTQTGIGFLGNEGLSDEQRTAEFRKLLNSNFDMATIGRFALGRYWKTATPAQQSEYQKLFKTMIVKIYSRRFKDYNGQKLEITGARVDGETDVMVSSSIIPPDGQKVSVDWRVRNNKVVDILVEGVSMALTQRSDFASVIQRGGGNVDVLLQHLRQQ